MIYLTISDLKMSTKFAIVLLLFFMVNINHVNSQIRAKSFIGDGSQLENVKSYAAYNFVELSALAFSPFITHTIAQGSIDIPGKGIVMVTASGNAVFNYLIPGLGHLDICINNEQLMDNNHLISVTDDGTSLTDWGKSWSIKRIFTIDEAIKDYEFYCIGTIGVVSPNTIHLRDLTLTAVFYPTGENDENSP